MSTLTYIDLGLVAPALEKYARGPISDLWKRPGLSTRERSLVTLSALVARNQALSLPYYLSQALDHGVQPREISELITHLAFYSSWPNAMSAAAAAEEFFIDRRIGPDQLSQESPVLLPLDESSEARRAAHVEQQFGNVAPGVVHYTTDLLFLELWRRPDLAPRDRSLVTVSALIAGGQAALVTFYLGRAMDHGLTQIQASEMLTQLAFYAGWPNVFSALPVVKEVFEKRSRS